MRIEECFLLFQKAAVDYDIKQSNVQFSVSESDTVDHLICDIALVVSKTSRDSVKKTADIIALHLPFETEVLDNGYIKFNLWQEVK